MNQATPLKLSRLSLWTLFAINAISVFGYATFTLNPVLLGRWPWAAMIFSHSYSFFARAQILAAIFCLALELYGHSRWRWLRGFALVCAISALSETLGTTYGVPFGKYEYTDLLGAKFLDRVPYLIPLSWFFMGVVSFRLARVIDGGRKSAYVRLIVGTVLISSWDLTLDPAMSHLSQFWVWETPGLYFGAPLSNLFGWVLTGLLIMITLESLEPQTWLDRLPLRFSLLFYVANLSLPIGLVAASGLWGPLSISAATYAALYLTYVFLRRNDLRLQYS